MPDEHPLNERLIAEVSAFADEMTELLAQVFDTDVEPFMAQVVEGASTLVIIEQQPATGVVLMADGQPLLRVTASYRCAWDHAGKFLAVRESTLGVYAVSSDEPLFRYDFNSECDGKVPGAHLNVHGHRDEMVFALAGAGRRLRGKSRSTAMDKGRVPRLATFHFPIGGPRFRPSLEDVVEIVVREFGLTTLPGWETVIREGRARWREKQLRAAVRDDPEVAADALRQLGYTLDIPADESARRRRDERVHAL